MKLLGVPTFDGTNYRTLLQPSPEALARLYTPGVAQNFSCLIVLRDGVASRQDLFGTQKSQLCFEGAEPLVPGAQPVPSLFTETLDFLMQEFPPLFHNQGGADPTKAVSKAPPGDVPPANLLPSAPQKAGLQIVEPLKPVLKPSAGMEAGQALPRVIQRLEFIVELQVQ